MLNRTKKNNEQRHFPRVNINQDGYFLIDNLDSDEIIKCWCRNLSEGGLSINTEEKLHEDVNSIKILYRINSSYRQDRLIIKSTNRDQHYNKYGCQFAEMDEKRDILINKFMSQLNQAKQ